MSYYPPVAFHFSVHFGFSGQNEPDTRFQEVSGLSVSLGVEEVREGGENRFTHRLPTPAKYGNLVLKRGLLLNSEVSNWIEDAVMNFIFKPTDINITLLNEKHLPLRSWTFTRAWPVKWQISDFKSTGNEVVIETLELAYASFRKV
jgi:phage tail-like protein